MSDQTQINIKAHRSILLKLSKIIQILEQNAPDFVAPTKSVLESVSYSPPEDFSHHLEKFMYGLPKMLGEDYGKPQEQLTGWKKEMIDIWVMPTDQFLIPYQEKAVDLRDEFWHQ